MAGEMVTVCSFWEAGETVTVTCVLSSSESYRSHRLWADRVLDDGNVWGYCFLLPSESDVARSGMMEEFTFVGTKVGLWRSSIYRSNQRIQDFIHWYHLQSHMKSHENKSIHSCFVSQHFLTWGWDQKFIIFDMQLELEEESDFLHDVAIQAGQNLKKLISP